MKYIKENKTQIEIFDIVVKGNTKVGEREIPVIEGGFGEEQRVLTDKMIAEIHSMRVPDVRRRICDNIIRFKENIDYIDLKNCCGLDAQQFGYTKMQQSKADHLFLLSERGYSKIIKIMDTDLAWEVHDKLMDEYFTTRKTITEISKETMLLVNIAKAKDKVSQMVAIGEYDEYCKQQAECN